MGDGASSDAPSPFLGKTRMKIKSTFLLVIFTTVAAHAQTVGPLITECGPKCSGAFKIQNDGFSPMTFTIEPASMRFDPGAPKPTHTPLNPGVTVRLSQSSGRLGPKEMRAIDFTVRCEVLPCAVQLLTGFVGGHTINGIAMRLVIPHSVYVDSKAKGARQRILVAAGILPPTKK
jgi:hypothetical protein